MTSSTFTGASWQSLTTQAINKITSASVQFIHSSSKTWRTTVQEALNGKYAAALRPLLETATCADDVKAFILACYLPKTKLNMFVEEPDFFRKALQAIAGSFTFPEGPFKAYVGAIKRYAKELSEPLDKAMEAKSDGKRDKSLQQLELRNWLDYSLTLGKRFDGIDHFVEKIDPDMPFAVTFLKCAIQFGACRIDNPEKRGAWLASGESLAASLVVFTPEVSAERLPTERSPLGVTAPSNRDSDARLPGQKHDADGADDGDDVDADPPGTLKRPNNDTRTQILKRQRLDHPVGRPASLLAGSAPNAGALGVATRENQVCDMQSQMSHRSESVPSMDNSHDPMEESPAAELRHHQQRHTSCEQTRQRKARASTIMKPVRVKDLKILLGSNLFKAFEASNTRQKEIGSGGEPSPLTSAVSVKWLDENLPCMLSITVSKPSWTELHGRYMRGILGETLFDLSSDGLYQIAENEDDWRLGVKCKNLSSLCAGVYPE